MMDLHQTITLAKALHKTPGRKAWCYLPITDTQIQQLKDKGLSDADIEGLDRGAASQVISLINDRHRQASGW